MLFCSWVSITVCTECRTHLRFNDDSRDFSLTCESVLKRALTQQTGLELKEAEEKVTLYVEDVLSGE